MHFYLPLVLDDFENELNAPIIDASIIKSTKAASICDEIEYLVERELPSCDEL